MKPEKPLIRRSFEQAAATYDAAAEVQRLACQQLADALPAAVLPESGLILDAGCGTGYGLRLLLERFPAARGIGLDIAETMLHRARPLTTLVGDIEQLPFASASVDLYWSSLTAQWCALDVVLSEAVRVLRRGGQLALATLGTETFSELRTAFAHSDNYRHTLNFLTPDDIFSHTRQAGFQHIEIRHQPLLTYHKDLRSLLQSIKAIGANQIGSGQRRGLMSRTAWQRVEAAYEQQRLPDGLPLTYDLILLVASM